MKNSEKTFLSNEWFPCDFLIVENVFHLDRSDCCIDCFLCFIGCCSSSKTGEEQLKGVITWPSTLADTNSTVDCPFNDTKINNTKSRHAVRFCRSDEFLGATWNEANTNDCPYKTKTTRALEKISHVSKIVFHFIDCSWISFLELSM